MTPVIQEELDRLVFALCDGRLESGERDRLDFLLRDDPACRLRYLDVLSLHANLGAHTRRVGLTPPPQRVGRRRVLLATAGGIAAVAGGLAWWYHSDRSASDEGVARLDRVNGAVTLVDEDGRDAGAEIGGVIPPGLTVVTGALDSTAEIALGKFARIVLGGDTAVTIGGPTGVDLTLVRGMIAVDARDRSVDDPVRCATSDAVLRLAATRAAFDRTDGQTRVAVLNGTVGIVTGNRNSPDVVLKDGQFATVGGPNATVARQLAIPPDTWKLDVTKTPRPRSLIGTVMTEGLPPGSLAGLRAVVGDPGPFDQRFEIRTPNLWTPGAFALHDDTVIRVRYRIDRATSVHLLIVSRGAASALADGCVNFFAQLPATDQRVGEWQVAEVPLSRFVPPIKNHRKGPRVAAFMVLETRGPDAGLVIDEVSASRK